MSLRADTMRGVVILNPKSGRGQGARQMALTKAEIARLGLNLEVWTTEHPKHAIDLARQAAGQSYELIAAAGGDGTLNEVVNGMIGSTALFAAIPLGTGNDFCRTLGYGTDWNLALAAIAECRTIPIDVGRCASAKGETHFINIAGCGFDVEVAVRINTGLRRLRGTTAYIAGVLGTFVTYKAEKMKISVDGVALETEVMLCAIANARSYGGAMLVAPNARIDDGHFDVVIVEKTTRFEFLGTFPKVFKGTHLNHAKVKSLRGTEVVIETPNPRMALVDGELFESTPITFTLLPKKLMCVVPANFEAFSG